MLREGIKMSNIFEFNVESNANNVWWFSVKSTYSVRIDEHGQSSCDCMAGMMRLSGRKLKVCKHIKSCMKLISLMRSVKHD